MAKTKKKTTKKSVKTKTVKKRKVNKKVVRKRTKAKKSIRRKVVMPHNYYLHRAKEEIMADVPIMPCTVIKKDRNGRLYAHTQAEKVYAIYREKMAQYGLQTRRIEGCCYESTRPSLREVEGVWQTIKVSCVRYEGKWEVCHKDSGEIEHFSGAGDGDNEIWSVNSAQTVAKKCGLLDYFEVAWPQPTDWLELMKNTVEELPPEELHKALIEMIPAKIMTATSIGEELCNYFNSVYATHKKGK